MHLHSAADYSTPSVHLAEVQGAAHEKLKKRVGTRDSAIAIMTATKLSNLDLEDDSSLIKLDQFIQLEPTGKPPHKVLAAVARQKTGGRRLGRSLTSSSPTYRWGCDDALVACAPVCLQTTGLSTVKVTPLQGELSLSTMCHSGRRR